MLFPVNAAILKLLAKNAILTALSDNSIVLITGGEIFTTCFVTTGASALINDC